MAIGYDWDLVFNGQPGSPPGCMGTDAWCGEMPEALTNVSRRAYYANIQFVDEWIGNIIQALNETGQLNNTLYVLLFLSFLSSKASCLHLITVTCKATTTTGARASHTKVAWLSHTPTDMQDLRMCQ